MPFRKVYSYEILEGSDFLKELSGKLRNRNLTIEPYIGYNSITPNDLLIGYNGNHHIALSLNNDCLPLLVFDEHTDMYYRPGSRDGSIWCGNWIYYALRQGRSVHLITEPLQTLAVSRIPKIGPSQFRIYSNSLDSHNFFRSDGTEISIKFMRPPDVVDFLKNTRKQISIDFDYFQARPRSFKKVLEILRGCALPEDFIDIWFDRLLSVNTQINYFTSLLDQINLIKI